MNDIIKVPDELHPLALMRLALDKGADPDKLKALMELSNQWNRDRAAEAFAQALTAFQAECPTVFKSRKTTSTDKFEGYTFASFDDIMYEASPLLAKHKIVVTFSTEPAQNGLKIICRVRVGTHFEDSNLTIPIPNMKVNDTQKFGAAVSYAKRYALCAALNIIVTDEDDDATKQWHYVNEDQIREMNVLIEEKAVDLSKFLAWAQIERLDLMPQDLFPKAIDALRRSKGQKARTA